MHAARKMQLLLKVHLSKPRKADETTLFLQSLIVPVYGTGLPQSDFLAAVDKLLNALSTVTVFGSGWILDKTVGPELEFATFNPIRGSSYLSTPPELDASHLLLNIQNRQDDNCFLYCFTAAWHLKHGPLLYNSGFDSRKNQRCKINLFRYIEKQLVPLRVTREISDVLEIDLLLVDDGQEYHYIMILGILRLVSIVRGTTTLCQRVLCRNCFHICMNESTYKRPRISCLQHEPALIKMPTPDKTKLKFENFGAR